MTSTSEWLQCNITFPDRQTAQHVAAHELAPALAAAQDAGHLHCWWFLRKNPWRLRYLLDDPTSTTLADALDALATNGRITSWTTGIYEPETLAFGGPAAMDIAHALFHQDSRHLLTRAACAAPVLGMRETSVLLCSVMLRAAGLDWYEQGDVWAQVAALRPASAVDPHRAAVLSSAMRRLMTANPHALSKDDGPLAGYDAWVTAFEQTGQALADLARHGRLQRGLRAVLAHHVIFHANRAGLPLTHQAAMAALAVDTVFAAPPTFVSSPPTAPAETRVNQMTTLSENPAPVSPEQLRDALTDQLRDHNLIRTPAVEGAVRRTPRHLFVPGTPLEQAYANAPLYTKTDGTGAQISAASQPGVVAMMLEQLAAQPGDRIFEAGAGTGYNAALMATIVGPTGHVTTVDVDEDLVDGAREHLAAAGVDNVNVVLGDGALGYTPNAPYDKAIATVGAWEVPTAWLEQLAPGGRLVVPLRLRGVASRSIVFERDGDRWTSRSSELAVFMPLRGGIGDDPRRIVALTPEHDVTLQVHNDQTADPDVLAGVLKRHRHEEWTGVLFPVNVSFEWMDLWLCLRLDNPLMRMSVQPTAKERDQVAPMFGWGAMATVRDSDLAYLTIRPAQRADDGGALYEVGVIAHGTTGQDLAQQVAEEIRLWDAEYRTRSVTFELPDTPAPADPDAGRFLLHRPSHPIAVTWE